ncbi:MAG: type II toxin-antitoxin system VapC family toxin [Anaerolineae bacterium]|nr:type II toxin-antitoxin system VapC family toxin [Anaerolineales bacterium]MCQ3973297.1 VapC toxin family PIN domain ribonuclease [Anaerolineae bacterium]
MTTYYLDTSALSKRYVQEIGTVWVRTLVAPTAGHTLLTARLTMVEVYSALARRQREGSVPVADYAIAAQAFTIHSATEYEFVELDLKVITLARDLLERHPLRAYDAVQLASALIANQALQAAPLPPLIFLSADDRLNLVAATEGLTVDNPNLHP